VKVPQWVIEEGIREIVGMMRQSRKHQLMMRILLYKQKRRAQKISVKAELAAWQAKQPPKHPQCRSVVTINGIDFIGDKVRKEYLQ